MYSHLPWIKEMPCYILSVSDGDDMWKHKTELTHRTQDKPLQF